jgi:hypothetical protein
VAEQLPETERQSLREFLREGLDHETIKAAIERSLAGGNESARVACVKFLSDLELYRKTSDECPRCAKFTEAESAEARAKVDELIARMVEGAVRDVFDTHRTEALRANMSDPERHDSQMMKLVRLAVMRGLDGREGAFEAAVETAVGRLLDAIANGVTVPGDVSAERCEAILATLEEHGLLVPGHKVDELVEQKAQERLQVLKAEHGIPA